LKLVLLELFTTVLNDHLPLLQPAVVPDVDAHQYNWTLYFGQEIVHQVEKIGFQLGAHGIAEFDLENCEEEMRILWRATTTLQFDDTHGFALLFNNNPAFEADVNLTLHGAASKSAVTDDACVLKGRLGFVGTDLIAQGGVFASFMVRPP